MKKTILTICSCAAVVTMCLAADDIEVKTRDKRAVNVYCTTNTTAGQYLIKAWPQLNEDKSKIVLNTTILRNKNRISRHLEPVKIHWVVPITLVVGTKLDLNDVKVYEINKHPDVLLDREDLKKLSEFDK